MPDTRFDHGELNIPGRLTSKRHTQQLEREYQDWKRTQARERKAADQRAREQSAFRAQAEREAAAKITPEMLATAKLVRDKWGWHRVIRVNAKTVTVATEHSWTAKIARDKVIQVAS